MTPPQTDYIDPDEFEPIQMVCEDCGILYDSKKYAEDGTCRDCWRKRLHSGYYD